MAKRMPLHIKANKDFSEALLGPLPGRPTFSERVGYVVEDWTGIPAETATDLFHLWLIFEGGKLLANAIQNRAATQQGA